MSENLLARRADPFRLLLRPREAATALAVSPRTLWQLTQSGQLSCLRISGRGRARAIRYAISDLQDWIAKTKASQVDAKEGAA